jgi:hypothetical protein
VVKIKTEIHEMQEDGRLAKVESGQTWPQMPPCEFDKSTMPAPGGVRPLVAASQFSSLEHWACQ